MKVFSENLKILRLKGNDVQDFLQRVSTNDFRNFENNSVRRTVFSNDKGRIVDFISVLKFDGLFILAGSSGKEEKLKDFMNKFIVSEDIDIEIVNSIKYTLIPEFDNDYEFMSGCNYVEGNYFYIDDYRFRKIVILGLNDNSDFIKLLLEQPEWVDNASFKDIAIEKGYLYDSKELNEEINPLECGLKEFVSFNKGCYIGQEVIGRMDTQGKVPKMMVKINSDYQLNESDKIYFREAGIDNECGFVTSVGKSAYDFTGLGFIRSTSLNENFKYYINNDAERIIFTKQI
jgi:tRNA-modifying protein YgfZ